VRILAIGGFTASLKSWGRCDLAVKSGEEVHVHTLYQGHSVYKARDVAQLAAKTLKLAGVDFEIIEDIEAVE